MGTAQSKSLIGKWRTKCGAIATVTHNTPGGYLGTVKIHKGEVHNLHRDMDFPCAWDKQGKNENYKDGEWDLIDRIRPEEEVNG